MEAMGFLQADQVAGQAARLEGSSVWFVVSDEARRRASVCGCARTVDMMEMQAPAQEQNRAGPAPHLLEEHLGFGAREDQRHGVAVVCTSCEPNGSLAPVRRVAPHPSVPSLF